MERFFQGKRAKDILDECLESDLIYDCFYPAHKGAYGVFREGKVYVAFDNRDCCCWVEEFKTKEKAISWAKGEYEIPI